MERTAFWGDFFFFARLVYQVKNVLARLIRSAMTLKMCNIGQTGDRPFWKIPECSISLPSIFGSNCFCFGTFISRNFWTAPSHKMMWIGGVLARPGRKRNLSGFSGKVYFRIDKCCISLANTPRNSVLMMLAGTKVLSLCVLQSNNFSHGVKDHKRASGESGWSWWTVRWNAERIAIFLIC